MVAWNSLQKARSVGLAPLHSVWGGWLYQETRVELMLGAVTLLWGLCFLHSPASPGIEPIARAIYQVGHVAMPIIAILLVCVSLVQALATYYLLTWLRRLCLVCVLFFYSFAVLCFWTWPPHYPVAFLSLAILFSLWRLIEMAGGKT